MNTGLAVFPQLLEFLPDQQFQKCVDRYGGGRYLKTLSSWDQYLAMAFAQLTYRESLRDIEACLGSIDGIERIERASDCDQTLRKRGEWSAIRRRRRAA